MTRNVDNLGIGALYGSFNVELSEGEPTLTTSDVGKAVVLSDDNTIGIGSDGDRLLGRLEAIEDELATVQVAGVVRLSLAEGKTAPDVGDGVVVDGAGAAYQAPALGGNDPAGGNVARGVTLAVDATAGTADILL
ncbi:hypothetical protein HS125_17005 [bacterium]|nr:hypothetical protein [bacterium]